MRLLILKCLEKDKDKRSATAREVWEALLEVERAIPAAERALPKLEPAAAKEITVSFRPKRLLLGGAVVAALAVVGLAVWYIFIRPAPMRRPSPADPAPAAESAQRSLPAPVKLPEVRRIDVPPSAPLHLSPSSHARRRVL